MPEHWILRIGDGEHFNSSSLKNIWGVNSKHSWVKSFMVDVKEGDLLWFVTSKTKGKIVAVASFISTKERILGPLIALTYTNEELGWNKTEGDWDIEVHYKDLYNLTHCDLYSEIKSPLVIRKYKPDGCKVNLPIEYPNICRYSKVTRNM